MLGKTIAWARQLGIAWMAMLGLGALQCAMPSLAVSAEPAGDPAAAPAATSSEATATASRAQSLGPDADVRQIWQMLDYIGVDYREAVADGEVRNASEYEEMREFAATAGARIATLPEHTAQPALLQQAGRLQAAIAQRRTPEEVAELSRALAGELLSAYPVQAAPAAPPDRRRGAVLYQAQCASCHGATGAGNGPAGQELDPPPIAFTDQERARERSLFSLYQTLSQGVQGTSMAAFDALPEADRWALAFYVGSLAYAPQQVEQGERLWRDDRALRARFQNLDALTRVTQAQLAAELGDESRAAAVSAFLRARPGVLAEQGLTLARNRLAESVRAYEGGDAQSAQRLALSAYLDGFEPIEPRLAAIDSKLLVSVETAMGRYRSLLADGAPIAQIRAQAEEIDRLFDEAGTSVQRSASDTSAAFLGSYTILVREGLEALLIVVAMIAFLRKAERRDVVGYVHAGWVGALLAGVLTWVAATTVIAVSGAGRELTEGISSVFAAIVLLSVGLWMHRKSLAGRWQRYVNEQLSKLLDGRSVWLLAGLSFLVVYREVFETILFYVALWSDGNGTAILGGFAAGVVTLAVVAYVLLRSSARLPIGKFFSVSSMLMAILAIVLAGKGVSALQEAGVLGFAAVHFPRVDLLGVYPSLQGLLAQAAVALCAIAGFLANRSRQPQAQRPVSSGSADSDPAR